MAETLTPPPGFELQSVPPPPEGFEVETPSAKQYKFTALEKDKTGPELLENVLGAGRGALQFAKEVAPGMIGGGLGAAAGAPLGPAGIVGGEMLGSGGMTWLAQKLGINPESKLDIGLNTIAPGIGRGLPAAGKMAQKITVGMYGTRPLIAQAGERLLQKWMAPAATSKALYEAAEATQKMIPYKETANTLEKLLKHEVGRMPTDAQQEAVTLLDRLAGYANPAHGLKGFQMNTTQPISNAMAEVRRLGFEARKAFKADKSDIGNMINEVRASLLDDLERAGVPEVKAASKAYRKEAALEELGRLMGKSEASLKIADFAKKNPLFRNTFSSREMALIEKVAHSVEQAVPTGMAGAAGRLLTTGAGAYMGGGVLGGLVGLAGPEAARYLFTTPLGQQFIEKSLSSGYKIGPQYAAVLAQFARGLIGTNPEE